MPSVLIVEDEPKVSLLIKTLIQWDDLGLQLSGIADNGQTAWELIRTTAPDIVITDIRMPVMNGLELIQMARNESLNTHFIIISGYRHFDYAHQAIKFGVEDYLLKPINQKELNDTLRKIVQQRNQDIERTLTQPDSTGELLKSRSFYLRELIEKIIENSPDVKNLDVVNRTYGVHFQEGWFHAIAIKLDYKNHEALDLTFYSLITEKIMEIAACELNQWTTEKIIVARKLGLVVCILSTKEDNRIALNKVYGSLLSGVQDYLFAFKDYEVTLAIGQVVNRFENLYEAATTAKEALQFRIKLGVGRKIFYDKHTYSEGGLNSQFLLRLQTKIGRALEALDSEQLKKEIAAAFQTLEEIPTIAPGSYYELAEELIRLFFDQMPSFAPKQIQKEKNGIVHQVEEQFTLSSLISLLQEKLGVLLDAYREQQISQVKKPIREAKRFLEEHYMEKVSLEDVARIVNFNPVYFSVVFKKETGSNFGDYIVQLRIEAAKSLLRETNLTVMAVAHKVGYEDPKYFSQLFTKVVGINPGVYRKLYA